MDEKILKAIGEPKRFLLLELMAERSYCVRALARKSFLSESAVSQHLKVMREAGLIYGEKYGYHTHYMPVQETMDSLLSVFTQMQKQSAGLNRDVTVCQCEFRTEEKAK